jgi:dienelactone hydrolase
VRTRALLLILTAAALACDDAHEPEPCAFEEGDVVVEEAEGCPVGGVRLTIGDDVHTVCRTNDDLAILGEVNEGCAVVGYDLDDDGVLDRDERAQIEPGDPVREAPRVLIACRREQYGGATPYAACPEDRNVILADAPGELIDLPTLDEAVARRAELIEYGFGVPALPDRAPDVVDASCALPSSAPVFTDLGAVTCLEVHQELGADSLIYLLEPAQPNDRLFVLHEGHRAGFDRERATIQHFLSQGYAVLFLAMPIREWNPPLVQADGSTTRSHFRLFNQDLEQGTHLKLFLAPLAIALRYARAQVDYEAVVAAGISGGGWTVMYFAAVDPTFDVVFPVASSYPLFGRRTPEDDWGDPEQNALSLYAQANYLELYAMSAIGRRSVLIYNRDDGCCFAGEGFRSWAPSVQSAAASLGGDFEVLMDTTHQSHIISDQARAFMDEQIALALP